MEPVRARYAACLLAEVLKGKTMFGDSAVIDGCKALLSKFFPSEA